MSGEYPERIICLTQESAETLYLLEEDWRIVGVSKFTDRPANVCQEKPVISQFTKAQIPDIIDLSPDLVLGFSDIQAEIASLLIAEGVEVHIFNYHTIHGILRMIRTVGAIAGCSDKSRVLTDRLSTNLEQIRADCNYTCRPRVYFEEWDNPMISGIGWVSELIEIAGGIDVFADLSTQPLAKNRVVSDANEVVRRSPDIIIGSWCGKAFSAEEVAARPGWQMIPAIQDKYLYEIDSSIILPPGPAALTEGAGMLQRIIAQWKATHVV